MTRARTFRSAAATPRADGPPRRRLVGLLVVLSLLFVGVIGRLVDLQVVSADRFVEYGASQRIRTEVLPGGRGSLLDRNGAELVMSVPSQTVVADPRMIEDPQAAAATLAPIVGVDEAALAERLGRRDSAFEYVARQVDDAAAADVRAARVTGVFLQAEPSRSYPSGETAAGVIGRADVDGVGVSGLERQFDEILTGTPGEVLYERSLNGVAIPVGQHQLEPAQPGDDVQLTLDRSLQYVVEEALADRVRETGAQGGTAIVMVPGTGEVLAMAGVETDAETGDIELAGYNTGLVDTFAPGSVIKMVTIGGSLEEGLTEPTTPVVVPYALEVADHTYQDSELHGTETWDVTRVLVDSSNVGAIQIGQDLGRERVWTYLDNFGFGRPTGLDFPGEAAPALSPWQDWYETDLASTVIGTGLSVNAMQVLAAYNVVANDGVYVSPRLVDARIGADGERRAPQLSEPHRVLSEATSDELATMLTGVVTDGTGTRASIPGYDVAGKTGTAWKARADGTFGDDGDRDYMATFVGFAPVEDPRVSVIVVLDQPRNVHSGGSAAAPAFARITEQALRLLDVPPTGSDVLAVSEGDPRVRAATTTQHGADSAAPSGAADG
jgi:cell division protein FtsI (penicillin-binding protein 3)